MKKLLDGSPSASSTAAATASPKKTVRFAPQDEEKETEKRGEGSLPSAGTHAHNRATQQPVKSILKQQQPTTSDDETEPWTLPPLPMPVRLTVLPHTHMYTNVTRQAHDHDHHEDDDPHGDDKDEAALLASALSLARELGGDDSNNNDNNDNNNDNSHSFDFEDNNQQAAMMVVSHPPSSHEQQSEDYAYVGDVVHGETNVVVEEVAARLADTRARLDREREAQQRHLASMEAFLNDNKVDREGVERAADVQGAMRVQHLALLKRRMQGLGGRAPVKQEEERVEEKEDEREGMRDERATAFEFARTHARVVEAKLQEDNDERVADLPADDALRLLQQAQGAVAVPPLASALRAARTVATRESNRLGRVAAAWSDRLSAATLQLDRLQQSRTTTTMSAKRAGDKSVRAMRAFEAAVMEELRKKALVKVPFEALRNACALRRLRARLVDNITRSQRESLMRAAFVVLGRHTKRSSELRKYTDGLHHVLLAYKQRRQLAAWRAYARIRGVKSAALAHARAVHAHVLACASLRALREHVARCRQLVQALGGPQENGTEITQQQHAVCGAASERSVEETGLGHKHHAGNDAAEPKMTAAAQLYQRRVCGSVGESKHARRAAVLPEGSEGAHTVTVAQGQLQQTRAVVGRLEEVVENRSLDTVEAGERGDDVEEEKGGCSEKDSVGAAASVTSSVRDACVRYRARKVLRTAFDGFIQNVTLAHERATLASLLRPSHLLSATFHAWHGIPALALARALLHVALMRWTRLTRRAADLRWRARAVAERNTQHRARMAFVAWRKWVQRMRELRTRVELWLRARAGKRVDACLRAWRRAARLRRVSRGRYEAVMGGVMRERFWLWRWKAGNRQLLRRVFTHAEERWDALAVPTQHAEAFRLCSITLACWREFAVRSIDKRKDAVAMNAASVLRRTSLLCRAFRAMAEPLFQSRAHKTFLQRVRVALSRWHARAAAHVQDTRAPYNMHVKLRLSSVYAYARRLRARRALGALQRPVVEKRAAAEVHYRRVMLARALEAVRVFNTKECAIVAGHRERWRRLVKREVMREWRLWAWREACSCGLKARVTRSHARSLLAGALSAWVIRHHERRVVARRSAAAMRLRKRRLLRECVLRWRARAREHRALRFQARWKLKQGFRSLHKFVVQSRAQHRTSSRRDMSPTCNVVAKSAGGSSHRSSSGESRLHALALAAYKRRLRRRAFTAWQSMIVSYDGQTNNTIKSKAASSLGMQEALDLDLASYPFPSRQLKDLKAYCWSSTNAVDPQIVRALHEIRARWALREQ